MLISEIYHTHPKTILGTTTVEEAVDVLMADEVNALIVVDTNEKILGVISLQDIAAHTIPRQFRKNIRMAAAMYKKGFFTEMCQELRGLPVTDVMRKEFTSVDLHDNIMAVTADFLKNDLYIVPVIEKGKLLGVITRTEIKKALHYGMRSAATT